MTVIKLDGIHCAIFKGGIFFQNSNNKSAILSDFLLPFSLSFSSIFSLWFSSLFVILLCVSVETPISLLLLTVINQTINSSHFTWPGLPHLQLFPTCLTAMNFVCMYVQGNFKNKWKPNFWIVEKQRAHFVTFQVFLLNLEKRKKSFCSFIWVPIYCISINFLFLFLFHYMSLTEFCL